MEYYNLYICKDINIDFLIGYKNVTIIHTFVTELS